MSMTLVLVREGRTVDTFQFDDEDRVRVGRGEDCDVRIDNLSVSRGHCEILRKDGFHVVVDLGSSNGTYVNGKRAKETQLDSGDVITLGEFSINYEGRFPAKELPLPLQAGLGDMTIQLGPDAAATPAPTGAPRRVTSKLRAHLTLESNAKNVLLQKSFFRIGGAPTNELEVPSRFAPRIAAILVRERFCFRLLDVSPKGNAVTVNGAPQRNVELDNGVLVDVAGLAFRFYRGLPQVDEGTAAIRMHSATRKLSRITKPR